MFCVSICRPSTRKCKEGEAQETLEGFICSSCYYSSMIEKIWSFSCDIFPSTSYQHTLLVLSCRRADCTDTIITVNARWAQVPVLLPHLQPHLSHRRIVSPLNKLPLPKCFVCFWIRQQSLHTARVGVHSIVRETSFCIRHSFPCLSKSRCFPFCGYYNRSRDPDLGPGLPQSHSHLWSQLLPGRHNIVCTFHQLAKIRELIFQPNSKSCHVETIQCHTLNFLWLQEK